MLLSDDRLTRRAIGGDQSAFAAIFERYEEPLYRYCLAILGDREDAEDALQGTMLKVLRALPGEERQIELKPWLYRIAHNESVELIRRRRPREELDTELVAGGVGLAEEAGQRQRLRQLLNDLDQLPERQRGTLVMRELGGLGFEEIGAALGTSAAVARQTLYEARLGLREMDAGREMGCDEVMREISDADGRVLRRRDIRAHLRGCESCRSFREEIDGRERDLAALSPLPVAVAAGLLQTILGGGAGVGAGAGTGAAGAALGAGAAKTIGASTLLKGAATLAAVAVIGVGAADEGGLIHVGLPGDGSGSKSSAPAAPRGGSEGAAAPASAPDGAAAAPGTKSGAGGRAKVGAAAAVVGGTARGGDGKATAPATSPGNSAADARGSEPQPSSSASHGQETAAAHKATPKGAPKPKPTHPSHPAKPVHPLKPSHPAKPETAASPGNSASTPAKPAHSVQSQSGKAEAAPEPERPEPPGQPR